MHAKVSPWRSLKTRITVLMLVVFALGIWSLSFFVNRALQTDMVRLLGDQQFSVVTTMANEVNTNLAARLQALEFVAKLDAALVGNPVALQASLERRPVLLQQFNGGVWVAGLDGTAIASVPVSANRIGVNYMDRDFIAISLKEGKSTIGRPVMGKQLQAPVFAMTVPLRDAQGKVIGVMVGATNLGQPNFLDALTQGTYGKMGGYVLVAPQHQVIVTASDATRTMQQMPPQGANKMFDRFLQGYEGHGMAISSRGVEQIIAAKGVPVAGWFLALSVPTAEALAPLREQQQRLLWATLALTLLIGALTWLVLRRELAPVMETAQAMSDLADSTHVPQPLPSTQSDEIGMLVAGFNRILQTWTQRQSELQASEQQYRSLVENLSAGVVVHRPDTSISLSNPKAAELLGLTQDQMLGKTAPDPNWRFIHDDETPMPLEDYPVNRVLASQTPLQDYVLGVCHPGRAEPTWLIGNAFPMRDAQGKIFQVVVTFTDMTRRKQVEVALLASEERWKFAIEGAGDGLWDWNIQTGKAYYSTRYKAMLGFSEVEIGDTADEWSKRIHPDDLPNVFAALQPYMDGKPGSATVEFRMSRKDGTWLWTLGRGLVVARDADGKPLRMIGTNSDITERKQAETALRESEVRFRTMFELMPDAIVLHQEGKLIFVNPAAVAMFGASSENDLIGRSILELIHPENIPVVLARIKAGLETGIVAPPLEGRYLRLDGTIFSAEVKSQAIVLQGVPTILSTLSDITERKQAQTKLQLAAGVFTHALEGIMITTADATIIDVNDAFTHITGYSREDAVGHNPSMLSSGRHDRLFFGDMWGALAESGHWSGEIWNRRKDGEVFAEMLTISAVRDAQGNTQQFVALFSDISAAKEHQSQLERIAHFDALTNLPNRVLLADRLQQAMTHATRRHQQVAVAYLDLDGFKTINDRHGHEAGDQVLITLALRMKNALREGDTMARMGGDEFVAVLIDLEDSSASLPLIQRLLAAAALPVQLGELSLQVSTSLGVTFYPQAQDIDADQLLRQADQAMYQAKVAGKNRYCVFDAAQDSNIRKQHESLARIRLALELGELALYYQPKVNMRTGKVIGAEALIRWQHPEDGLLVPATFLPTIEGHPLAVDVGEWVVDTAMRQMEVWHAAGLDLPVSVNIGARQLLQDDFVERLQVILAKHPKVHPGCIELEVLETSALNDMDQVSKVIEDCAKIGMRFALDDFGTGYSSLTYLKRLHVTQLKIDQSFVRDMLDDPDDLAILQGIISLAAAFNREVIAEGVETVAHGTALLQLGCELAQGYGIARPMPPDQLPAWAATWRPDAAWAAVMSPGEALRSTDK